MLHSQISVPLKSLRAPEQRVVTMLRAWQNGEAAQAEVWTSLCRSMSTGRARSCLQAFEHMLMLLRKHGWKPLSIHPADHAQASADEADLARFVMAATEQERDLALAQATFLVSGSAILPLLCAASRFGLPLLCEECRLRVLSPPPPNLH
ncbi:hypothetical protein [uncultured Marivita sp.]|uniref:hypothetical protein n=1 Tax=uncultured Marivita sp. TaxID=888080 RepID=UPI00262C7894|nr:hypothetical protein [uncultured Marivita sp.]